MRLITVLLITGIMQVSAAGFAQKVTLNKSNAPLEDIIKELRKQTGYNFIITEDLLDLARPVNVKVKDAALEKTLTLILKNQSLNYEIDRNTVIIKSVEKPFLEKVIAFFQAIDVKGRIQNESGEPLAGATIRVKGREGMSTNTNANGEFSLSDIDETAVLQVTYTGYNSFETTARSFPSVVKLVLSSDKLDEVQVIAYGTTTRRLATGNVSSVKAADIEKQPVMNVLEALSGRVPGLEMTQQSGTAGGSFTIRIRGINSLRPQANNPLYIVDGVPFNSDNIGAVGGFISVDMQMSPLSVLNPSDIESISILKDADATSIYGSRGSNGVILITTKKGKSGKTAVSFNLSSGFGEIARKAEVLDRRQYLDMRYEAFRNDGIDFKTLPLTARNYPHDLNTWDTTRVTDWQEELLGGRAHFTNAQFSASGGNEQTSYSFGSGYARQTNVYPGDFADQRYNGRLTVNHRSLNNRFTAQFSGTYGLDANQLPRVELVNNALSLAPVAPALYTEDGKLNFENNTFSNPLTFLEMENKTSIKTLVSNANLGYRIWDGLTLKSTFAYTTTNYDAKSLKPSTYYSPTEAASAGDNLRTANFLNSVSNTWSVEPQLEYLKTIAKHKFNVLLGSTFQKTDNRGINTLFLGLKDDQLLENIAAASRTTGSNSISNYNYNAVFARIGYNFDDKYLLNLTGRRDGSSRFGPGKQFGNFGAVGAAWLFDRESFVKDKLPFLSHGKLRASYGISGNDIIGDYQFLATLSPIPLSYGGVAAYDGANVLAPDRLNNPNYRWETNRKAELALELGFFNNRVLFNANAYRNRSGNMLVNYPLSTVTGFTGIIDNLPALIQNTGLEFELSLVPLKNSNLIWNASLNLSLPKNELLEYEYLSTSSYRYTYVVGEPLNIAQVIRRSLDPQTGAYVNLNAAGQVASTVSFTDAIVPINLGKQFYGGINNSFSYKGIDLDFLFQFSKETGRYTNSLVYGAVWGSATNLPVDLYNNRWQQPGQESQFIKLTQNTTSPIARSRIGVSYDPDFYTDIFYVRLKNVALSYTLPQRWSSQLNIQNLKVSLRGQNLLTFTDYPGMDPENQSSALPPLRLFTAGLQFTL